MRKHARKPMNNCFQVATVSDFLGNEDVVSTLRKFLNSSSSLNALLIIGPSGSGKTTLTNLLLAENADAYCVLRPNYEEFSNHKDLANTVDKFLYMKNMHEIFFKKLKILFLDDVDILLTTDRYSNTYIQDIIAKLKASKSSTPPFKVLMTCSQGNEKRVTDLKKKCYYCHMRNPDPLLLCQRLLPCLDGGTNTLKDKLLEMARAYNGNVRSILSNLDTLTLDCDDRRDIRVSNVVFDKNILDIVQGILAAYPWTVKDLEIWLSVDPCLISYIMYDNTVGSVINSNQHLSRVLRSYAVSSVMESFLYNKSDQLLSDACNIWRCGLLKLATNDAQTKAHANLKYTTIPTRSANYYAAQKKNRVASSSAYSARGTFLSLVALGLLEDASINQRNRALLLGP